MKLRMEIQKIVSHDSHNSYTDEEFRDTKEVVRIRKSKNRQHNGQKKREKRTNNELQNIHITLKIE